MTDPGLSEARLMVPGAGTGRAWVEVERQPRRRRLVGALLILAVGVALAPIVFLVPPHFLWPVGSVAVASYLAWRQWRGTYAVVRFEGRCPRCDTPLEIESGTRVRERHALECYGCHRQPILLLDQVE